MKKWKPKHRIYRGKEDLDTDRIKNDEPSIMLPEVGVIALDPKKHPDIKTRKKVATYYDTHYSLGDPEYDQHGWYATRDWHFNGDNYDIDETYAYKDPEQLKKIEEEKKHKPIPSAFNPTELTDDFNYVLGKALGPIAEGAVGLWNNIHDKPVIIFTGDPSISYAGNAYYRTPDEQSQDVGNFFNHTYVGKGLKWLGKVGLGVLTPSQDFGVLIGIDNAIRNRDWRYLTYPGADNNYGFVHYPGDKIGEALNTEVDWTLPWIPIGKVVNKTDDVVRAANAEQAVKTTKTIENARLKNTLKTEQKGNFNTTETPVENVNLTSKRRWQNMSEEERMALSPEERLQLAINPKTNMLYYDYLDRIDKAAGKRLLYGIDNNIGYWDINKTPIFDWNMSDPEFVQELDRILDNRIAELRRRDPEGKHPALQARIKDYENQKEKKKYSLRQSIGNYDDSALQAFKNTKKGREIINVAKEYGLYENGPENGINGIIKNIFRNNDEPNAFAVFNSEPSRLGDSRPRKYQTQLADYIYKNHSFGKISLIPFGFSPYITMGSWSSNYRNATSRLRQIWRNFVKRHEQGHIVTYLTAEELPEEILNSLKSFFKDNPSRLEYFADSKGVEVAQRFSQVKDLYLLLPGEKLTWDQFLFGLKNYGKLTGGFDNNMTELYNWAATIKDPKLQNMILGHFNNPKNAYSMFGPIAITLGLGTAAATQQ